MRFAVVGAGAIGAYVGAALVRGGSQVTLIARGAHLAAMKRRGIKILSERGDFAVHPAATDEIEAVADADVLFVALKAYSLPALAPRLAAAIAPGTATIWAQNGVPWWYFQSYPGPLAGSVLESVDPGGSISGSIDPAGVIGCVVYCSAEIVEPGVIRHVEGTRFALGEPSGELTDRCLRISEAFVAGGLKAPVEHRLRDDIWLKLVGNTAFNPITALTKATLGELGTLPEMVDLLRALFEESAEVADRLGVTFRVSLEHRLKAGIAVGNHKTSMLQDLEAGKPLEYECLTGAVIELAKKLDVATPRTDAVHACIKLLDTLSQRPAEPATPAPSGLG